MSVARPQAAAAPPAPTATSQRSRPWTLVAGCLLVAAATLALPGAPTYDPMAWLVWGREIAHGSLDTVQGPSWKPLPVVFTTPFSLAGDALAPELWLVVARAGGLLGMVMGFRLARRLAGWPAGAIAALAILASEAYVYHAWRGNSEGLLVGLVLWAVERHLDGRREGAFGLGFAAALLRPEVWALWGLYGLWLAWTDRRARRLVAACFAVLPLAWLVPEHIGSGDLLRAATRALEPNLDSPAYAAFPALEVLRRSLAMVPLVVGAGALAALIAALRRRSGEHDHVALVLGGSAAALLAAVAVMTQIGFSGNLRYVLLPVALIGVLAGAGWIEAVRAVRGRLGALAATALAAAGLGGAVQAFRAEQDFFDQQVFAAHREALMIEDLANVVARAGGERRVNGCGPVYTTRFQTPVVAWTLHRRLEDVDIFPFPPGTTLAPRGTALAQDPRFETVAATARWVAGRACN